ncbi:MAG: LysM peptidoglycan-binding domain-containing protein [Myxococcales bacterium]|nr:LysM peptidoglycan-binding domain-containing protein [Myxococcales bacterium]
MITTCLFVLTTAATTQADRYEPSIVTDTSSTYRPAGTYVVQENDTLWTLSEIHFGNPFYWPVLWSYNPQVTNPHWIYPGDLLYLQPRMKEKTEVITFAKSRYSDAPRLEEVLARFKGFISVRDYKESGRLASSREEKEMLGEYDEAYLEFSIPKKILPGEEYTIYRVDRPVTDPDTGETLGYMIRHLGISRVLNVDKTKPYVKGLILKSWQEMQRGDLLTKRLWTSETVQPVQNQIGTWARILDTFQDSNNMGEHDYIIIDKGFKQKVRRGNRLVIRQRGDTLRPSSSDDLKKYPWETIGEVMVLEPFENTSMCIVLRSTKELQKGEDLQMIQGY